jgi:23S rRNA pseudouridine1911/1915/1917 synthase
MALHAARLALEHPRSGERLAFESPWPEDLAGWWEGIRVGCVEK